jgi:hypothetical protein
MGREIEPRYGIVNYALKQRIEIGSESRRRSKLFSKKILCPFYYDAKKCWQYFNFLHTLIFKNLVTSFSTRLRGMPASAVKCDQICRYFANLQKENIFPN